MITGNRAPARFRVLATLNKCCVVATRCIKADSDGSLDHNLCVCDVKLVTPKESMAIIAKGVELGEGGLRVWCRSPIGCYFGTVAVQWPNWQRNFQKLTSLKMSHCCNFRCLEFSEIC